jgi:serine/threonine protein kinase
MSALDVFSSFLGVEKALKFQAALKLLCNNNSNNVEANVDGENLLECVTELSSNLPLQNADVTILRGLCRGNSSIFLGVCDQQLVVVKEHVFSAGSFLLTSNILYEISMLLFLEHARTTTFQEIQANLPRVLQIETARNSLRIVLEHLPLTVEDVCDRRLPIPFLQHLYTQISKTVACLHKVSMVHRDIKPSNIRFRANGIPVLIDYDSCVFLNSNGDDATTFPICTLSARPPELLLDEDKKLSPPLTYNAKKLDIYSMGLLFLYLANSSRPLVSPQLTQSSLKQKLLAALPLSNDFNNRLSPEITVLVSSMLFPKPLERPSAEEVYHQLLTL